MAQENTQNTENAAASGGAEQRGHQRYLTLDKGYQASGNVPQPSETPNVGTTAVTPVAATSSTQAAATVPQNASSDQK